MQNDRFGTCRTEEGLDIFKKKEIYDLIILLNKQSYFINHSSF